MNYKKQNFENDQILTAEQLNYIEDGIVNLDNSINSLTLGIYTDGALYIFIDGKPVGSGILVGDLLGSTDGYIDVNNNIMLPDNLDNGTYTLKYENEDGTYTVIGQFTISKEGE